MNLEIREATLDDVEALIGYAAQLFAEDLPGVYRRGTPTVDEEIEFVCARIEPANSTLLLALADSEIIGLIDFVGNAHPEEAHAGVFGLSVSRERRGEGIGTALIEALLAWAPSHGIARIEARAFSTNPGAIALYERMGFEREGSCRRAVMRDGVGIDVVILARLFD